jgi:hypothetical protein
LRLLLTTLRAVRALALPVLRPESGRGEGRRRQIFAGLDLLCAALAGILDDRLLERGFGVIDGVELRHWLRDHGARPSSVGSGSVLWALYDLVFGYHRGDSGVPELAAGRGLLALLRLLGGYHDHFGYRMASSMAEVVIAPMYDLLRERGVHVAFFRDLRGVELDGDGALAAVALHRQVDVDVDGYDPFAWTGSPHERYWSIEPDWAQIGVDPAAVNADGLEDGLAVTDAEARDVLRVGVDVDDVILAVPAPVLADPAISGDLGRVPRWRTMLGSSASVATIAYQVWSDADGSLPVALNERFGPAVVSSYDQPFSTYCPMDQLAEVEQWKGLRSVSIGYGCGVWPEPAVRRIDTLRAGRPGLDRRLVLDRVQAEAAASLQRLGRLPDPPRRGVGSVLRRRSAPPAPPPAEAVLPATDDRLRLRPAGSRAGLPAEPAGGAAEPAGAGGGRPGRDRATRSLDAAASPDGGPHQTLWVRLNDAPAHRYVTTPPENPWFRIDPGATGVAHLWAAGDWTANLVDGGCVEAAVISAVMAARGVALDAGVDHGVVADCLPVIGEGSWLYHGGRGGPPPQAHPSAWSAPARAGALTSVPGPYASEGTTLYAWLAAVDPARTAEVARRCFSEMTGGAVEVEPIGSLAMITAGDIGQVSSLASAYRRLGRLAEKQVVVWLPCHVRWEEGAAGAEPPPFAMFVPYIWVDNPMSLTTGREGLGWPKALAAFDPPGRLSLPLALSVYGLASYGPEAVSAAGLPLLRISPAVGGGLGGVAEEAVSLTELGGRLVLAAVDAFGTDAGDAMAALVDALGQHGLPQLFAKSLIAADDDAGNDFDEVVTARATVTGVRSVDLLAPCELVVHDVASHPVRADLGLESQALPLGVRIEFDFRQESGTVRWSSWASPRQRRDRAARLRGGRLSGRAGGGVDRLSRSGRRRSARRDR